MAIHVEVIWYDRHLPLVTLGFLNLWAPERFLLIHDSIAQQATSCCESIATLTGSAKGPDLHLM